jgi:hypothetical protein
VGRTPQALPTTPATALRRVDVAGGVTDAEVSRYDVVRAEGLLLGAQVVAHLVVLLFILELFVLLQESLKPHITTEIVAGPAGKGR